jgi:hypothetical protein
MVKGFGGFWLQIRMGKGFALNKKINLQNKIENIFFCTFSE